MIPNRTLSLTVWLLACLTLRAADYYLSTEGDDSAAGTSPQTAWRTLGRAEQQALVPGDSVWLQGGARFNGGFYRAPGRSGTAEEPITLGSYGTGRATVVPGSGREGVMVHNAAGWRIQDLVLEGPGPTQTSKTGLSIFCDLPDHTKLSGIQVLRVEVHGFKYGGSVGGWNGRSGFRDVRVEDSIFRNNRMGGFSTYTQENYGVENITLRRCTFASNWGDPAHTTNNGSGLVLGQADGALVEHCLAYDNGRDCTANEGPVGIWAYQSRRVVFQYNRSVRNRASGTADGGGFDFDGGVTDSLMQYNFSAENDGAGYLLAGYSGSGGVQRVILRHNVSVNDGRRNNYAGILFWAASHNDRIRTALLHNNTVLVDAAGARGIPSAVRFYGGNLEGVVLRNNLFLTRTSAAHLLNAGTNLSAAQVLLENNLYACADPAGWRATWAGPRNSSNSWWTAATAQERGGEGTRLARFENPKLRDPWTLPDLSGLTPQTPLDRAWLAAWLPAVDSPALDAGQAIETFAETPPPTHDFAGCPWPLGLPDLGAFEVTETLAEWRLRQGLGSDPDPEADLDGNGRADLLDMALPLTTPGGHFRMELQSEVKHLTWWTPSTALLAQPMVEESPNLAEPWSPAAGLPEPTEYRSGWIRYELPLGQSGSFYRLRWPTP